jgi:sulfatase maturation enzyme AslB (radical SAM superfamily)
MAEVLERLAGCHIRDPDLDRRLTDRRARARTLPLVTHKEAKRSRLGPCADCDWLGTCHVCPASIANAPGNTDPDLIPEHQCAWNRLVLEHRRALAERLAAVG